MSDFDLDFGVRITGADESIATVGRVARANESAARTTTAAARSSSAAVAGLGQSVQQVGQRTGQAVGALGQMATQLGALVPGAGGAGAAVSQLGGAVGALSGAMGPLGVGLAAVTAAVGLLGAGMRAQTSRLDDARASAHALAASYDDLAGAAQRAMNAQAQQERLTRGGGTAAEQRGFTQAAQNRQELALRALNGDAGAQAELRQMGLISSGGEPGMGDRLLALGSDFVSGRGAGSTVPRGVMSEADIARVEALSRQSGQAAIERQALELAPLSRGGGAETSPTSPGAPRSGGGGARASAGGGVNTTDAAEREMARRRDVEAELMKAAEERDAAEQMLADKAQERADAEKERLQEGARVREEAAREAIATQRELEQASIEASDAFAASWRGSIDDVVDSWRDANRALRMSGGQMRSQADLLEMSMTSAGNSIADTIGGTMVGAFESALGAWLDGSKSFVEAAEDMVKGVLKALVIESIVQAVTETARGIASIASQDYAGGAAHLAAAAAWAAVGGVAGAAGAAMGGFGGGGGKDAAPSTAVTPSDASAQQQPSQPMVINVYPGGYITQRDVEAGLVDALNSAGREGRRLDPSLMGG